VTAVRGYGDRGVEETRATSGSTTRRSPSRANRTRRVVTSSKRRAFRKLVRCRTGSEGRINRAKRDFGLNRTRYTIHGARTWCGHGVFNHNPMKIAALTDTN